MYWSVGSYHALGYLPDRDKPTFELWRSAIHPDDLRHVDAAISTMLANQAHIDIEYRLLRLNGQVRWMRSVGSVHCDTQQIPDEIYGLQFDITQQKQLQEDLREQKRLLQAVLDHSSDSVVTLDANHTVLAVNRSLLKMFRSTEQDLVGRPIQKLFGGDGMQFVQRYIDRYSLQLREEQAKEISQTEIDLRDGGRFKASISISGFCLNNNAMRFLVTIANLTNERRQVINIDLLSVAE
jgi:PAS domain S-box-containing protein